MNINKPVVKKCKVLTTGIILRLSLTPGSMFLVPIIMNINFYYTSEEFFLYKITVDNWTIHHFSRQNELLTGT